MPDKKDDFVTLERVEETGFSVGYGDFRVDLPPAKKWRCTHGHRWESAIHEVGIQLRGELFGLAPQDSLDFCARCLVAVMKERLGQVREDP